MNALENVLDSFARELRRHCLMRGSIAEICRGTGINRQQFNKYLAGRMLPGSINMRKICSYLDVSEAELMRGSDACATGSANRYLPDERANDCLKLMSSRKESSGSAKWQAGRIPTGFYDCYLPFHGACHMLLRWLLQVSDGEKGQTFSCRTVVTDPDRQGWKQERFRYRGIVLPGVQDILLVGMSNMLMNQPSVISVSLVQQEGRRHFPALALTRRANGPMATLAALHYRGPAVDARQALARTGIVSMFDPDLDPVIAKMMSAAPEGGWNWMQSILPQHLPEMAMPAR